MKDNEDAGPEFKIKEKKTGNANIV